MPDSDPVQDNPRDTPNLPAVVKEGEVLRPAADNWLLRAIRTLFGWKAGSVRADLQVVLDTSAPDSGHCHTSGRCVLGVHILHGTCHPPGQRPEAVPTHGALR